MRKQRRVHPAWIAAAITWLTLVASAGYRSAPSVLIVPLEDAFGWSRDQISLAISINILLYGLTAPFAAALMERFTVRKVVMSALSAVSIGAFLTIFMTAPWHLMLLWGVVVGVGTGSMALVFAATIASRWFMQRRGLVTGALTAAAATGQLVFLPALSSIAINHGWKSVSITIAVAAAAVIPLIWWGLNENPSDIGHKPYGAPEGWVEPERLKGNAARNAIDALKNGAKHKDFWLLFGTFFVCGLTTNGLIGTHFIPAAHDHGMGEVVAASLLALIGIFDVIGTLGSGYLTDRVDPRKLLVFYYGFRGISLLLLPSILFATLHPSTLVFVIFYGLDWVATVPPTIALCRTVLGPKYGTVIYGWVFTGHQIGASVAALGAAILRVKLGDYSLSFYIGGLMSLIAAVAVIFIARGKSFEEIKNI
ncbi:MAG: MFS transporter [Candidatus Nanopelagicaceae bacterium]|jgi:MFS family permease